jgi:hypothetical protein
MFFTQATVWAFIHTAFNVLVVMLLLMMPLQGLAFGTTSYDRFQRYTYADGCVPYRSIFQERGPNH